MKILVINPNTTASMTDHIGKAARAAASPGTDITAVNPAHGPVSIEGYFDEAMSLAGLLDTIRRNPDCDAVVIACFDDTGLDAARCLTDKPVIGIGEAACEWLAHRRRGLTAPDADVRRAFAEGVAAGLRRAKGRSREPERPA